MSWEVKYRTEFTDILGLDGRIDIEEDSFSGSITTMQATGTPVRFSFLTNSDNIIENPIKGSTVEFSIYSDTNFQWVDMYSIYDLQYRVSIYHSDTTLIWRGFITPGQYQEPYDGPSYPVSIMASDSLGFLKNLKYTSDGTPEGTPYNGRILESQIILDILAKIQVVSFTEYVNVYETAMAKGTGDSSMDQLMIDADLFLEMNCYDVLEHLLKKYNSVIRQNIDGTVNIYRPYELINPTIYGRTFTGPTTKSSVTKSPSYFISRVGALNDLRDTEGGTLPIQQQFSSVTINQDYGDKESWVDNYKFEGNTFTPIAPLSYDVEGWTKVGGCLLVPITTAMPGEKDGVVLTIHNAYPAKTVGIQKSFGINAIITDDICYIEFEYLVYNFSTTDETAEDIYIKIKKDGEDKYLHEVSADICDWSDTVTYLQATTDAPVGTLGWINYKRKIQGIPVAGSYSVYLYSTNDAHASVYVAYRNIRFYATSDSVTISYRKVPRQKGEIFYWGTRATVASNVIWNTGDRIIHRTYTKSNSIYGTPVQFDSILGDVTDSNIDNVIEQFKGSLATYVSSVLAPSALWSTRGGSENQPLLQLICDEIAWQYKRPKHLIHVPIMEDNKINNLLHIDLLGCYQDSLNKVGGINRNFVFSQGTFNQRDREWEIDLVEVIPPLEGVPVDPPTDPMEYPSFGHRALYNWFAVDTGKLAPAGWHVATDAELDTLRDDLGGYLVAGGYMKEPGTDHWTTPNTGADNSSGLRVLGSGYRSYVGAFAYLNEQCNFLSSTSLDADSFAHKSLQYNSAMLGSGSGYKKEGNPVRFIKNDSTLANCVDYDGYVYPSVKIGTQVITAINFCGTHYNDGTLIPLVGDGTTWAALTTGAMCYYNFTGPPANTLSIDHPDCHFHNDGSSYDSNVFIVTHSDPYTYSWTNGGAHFSVSIFEDALTITTKGSNSSGVIYSDTLSIRMGSYTVTIGMVQYRPPD